MLTRQPDKRLDVLFPLVEIVLHFAGQNLPKLRIHVADVRRKRVHQRHQHEQHYRRPAHAHHPLRARKNGTTSIASKTSETKNMTSHAAEELDPKEICNK